MAELTQARLVDDDGTGLEVLRFDDSHRRDRDAVDLGFPEIRSVATRVRRRTARWTARSSSVPGRSRWNC
jgi:hypothetical protein